MRRPYALVNRLSGRWIPAFAGMTKGYAKVSFQGQGTRFGIPYSISVQGSSAGYM